MRILIVNFLLFTLLTISGAAFTQDANEFKGKYVGSGILEGGSTVPSGEYKLRIKISGKGKIRIIDVENIFGSGKLVGNYFKVVRNRPYQIFEGTIVDGVITGTTWGNQSTGDGTFSAKLKQ
jgi:hypothetical protein